MTEDTSPENLRKFLESDDPAMVRMGLSMAKGIEKPKDYHHTLVQTLQRLLTENVFDNSAMIMMGLSIVETIEIPEELFPHLAILTIDLIGHGKGGKAEEIRNKAIEIADTNDILYGFGVDAEFWSLGNADLIVKHLEQTESLWGWFRNAPDSNGYYELRIAIETFPWKSNTFSDGGERAEKLLKKIHNGDGELWDLERRWRIHMPLYDHGLILQQSAEEALVEWGKMNSEDSIWDDQDMDGDEYVLKELNNMSITDLRERCENNELKLSGSKKELIERLYDSVDEINYLL